MTSVITVARVMIDCRAVSVDCRLLMRASRSMTWVVTSDVPVCSDRTFDPILRTSDSASSHLATGSRKAIVATASPPVPDRSEEST